MRTTLPCRPAVLLTLSASWKGPTGRVLPSSTRPCSRPCPAPRGDLDALDRRKKTFEGVLLADLLDLVGAQDAQTLRATALNEYEIAIPASDAAEFGVLLAMSMDGKPLSRRDKGPIWIVYPRDGISRIQDERYDARWVWQLSKIEVR